MRRMKITDDHVKNVCGLGQGEKCCAFLASRARWECAKDIPGVRDTILLRLAAGTMVAKGDNCSGPPDFRPSP